MFDTLIDERKPRVSVYGENENTFEYNRAYPKRLNSRHFLLLREIVAGTPLPKAAEICGYTYSRAGVVVSSELFKKEVALLREQINDKYAEAHSTAYIDQARDKLVDECVDAAKKLTSLVHSEDDRVALSASAEVLDRVGITKPKESPTIMANLQVSDNLAFALQLKVEVKGG